MATRSYTWNGFSTNLTASIDDTQGTLQLDTTTGLRTPCYILLDADTPASREWVRVTDINGTTCTVTRNQTGSVGSIAHTAGAEVRSAFTHQSLDAIFTDIIALETSVSSLTSSLSGHTTNPDQHPEYVREADHVTALHDSLNINADRLDGYHAVSFSLATHDHDLVYQAIGSYADASHLHTGTYAPNTHGHSNATQSVSGYMSAADKVILDNLDAGGGNQTINAGLDLDGGGNGSTVNIDHENVQSTATSITGLTGAAVISGVGLNGRGHVNVLTQRNLTAANIGAATSSHTHTSFSNLTTGYIDSSSYIDAATEFRINGVKVLDYDSAAPGYVQLYSGNEPVFNGDGSNEVYIWGIPFASGAYQIEANEIVDGSRQLFYDTLASSRRFKEDEQPYALDPSILMGFRGLLRSFTYKSDPGKNRRVNYIVEDVLGILPPEAVRTDGEGAPIKFDVNWFLSALIEGYIDLSDRVDALSPG